MLLIVCILAFSIIVLILWNAFDIWKINHQIRILQEIDCRRKLKKLSLKREDIMNSLASDSFDIIVVGGGCVGTGCALDAASRGLKVGLIEAFDFGSQTSSKTTKLVHGGVRYLEKAIFNFSLSNLSLVLTALYERKTVMRIAPYLTYTVKIIVPVCRRIQIPVYFVLLKIYDWLSRNRSLGRSYLISGRLAKMYFGSLKEEKTSSAIVYHEGMMLDSRIVCLIAKTAAFYGATVANHVKLVDFIKNENGMIVGIKAFDKISEKSLKIKCKMIISAAGPFTDKIRHINHEKTAPIIKPSFGTHIVIRPGFGPENVGLLDSCSKDGRVVFVLPWQGHTLVGSTDVEGKVVDRKSPTAEDVDFLLNELNEYTRSKVTRNEVTSVWTGIRPLINEARSENDGNHINKARSKKTESIVRGFRIINDKNGLICVFGGKWTTFRTMAEKAIDMAIKEYDLLPENICLTNHISILGSKQYSRDLHYKISRVLDVNVEYAKHLLSFYGDRALKMKKYIKKYPNRLSDKYMFVEGEAIYCFENELAQNAEDIVNNRFEVGYYDVEESLSMMKKVQKILEKYCKEKNIAFKPSDEKYRSEILNSLGYKLIQDFKK